MLFTWFIIQHIFVYLGFIIVRVILLPGEHQEVEKIIRKCIETRIDLDTVAYNIFIKAMLEAGWYRLLIIYKN